jgi:hypothetical protein
MTKAVLEFIKDSPLFKSKYVKSKYQRLSDQDLMRELARYREYALQVATAEEERARWQAPGKQNLSVFPETLGFRVPNQELLKRCALYTADVVIDDPLFRLTVPKNDQSDAMTALVGMPHSESVDRERLAQAATDIYKLRSGIVTNFIRMLPVSYLHEPPEQVPFTSSDNGFADILPSELLAWFRENAEVLPAIKSERGWQFRGDPLVPGRLIGVHFKGTPFSTVTLRALVEAKVLSSEEMDAQTQLIAMEHRLPDEPPDQERFDAWVFQTVNQAAGHFYNRVAAELEMADSFGSTYLPTSPFVAELLNKEWSQPQARDLSGDVFNSVLTLELPILEGVSFEKLVDLRHKDGEAFHNFRIALEKGLRELRLTSDPAELQIKIQNLAHELGEVQVAEVNKKLAKIKRGLPGDVSILAGSLLAAILTGGLASPAVLGAAGLIYKIRQDLIAEVRENPAFFLWKLDKMK